MILRIILPIFFLLMTFVSPLYLTTETSCFEVNSYVKDVLWCWIVVVLLTSFQFNKCLLLGYIKRNIWLIVLLVFILVGWILQDIDFLNRNQFWLYLEATSIFFVLSTVKEGSAFCIENVLIYKLIIVAGISLFLSIYIYTLDPQEFSKIKALPPVYKHIRHFNYDTYFAFIVSIGLLLDSKRSKGIIYFSIFLLIYSTLWSYARGEIAGLFVFISVLIISKIMKVNSEETKLLSSIILLSMLLIFASGVDHYITEQWHKPGAIENVKVFTSSRTTIWFKSISTVVNGGILPILSGYGPDAYRLFGIVPKTVQPHSLYVQVFVEFGLLGLIGLGYLMFCMIKECYYCLMVNDNLFVTAIAAGVLGLFVYSSVDGLFYHAIPMLTISLMFALVVRCRLYNDHQN